MSSNPAVPSSRSRNGRRGRSRIGNTNWIAFSKYVRGPQCERSKGPPTLRSNSDAENDDQRPGAIENRQLFQIADEGEVEIRNEELLDADLMDINQKCRWGYADLSYQKQLMG